MQRNKNVWFIHRKNKIVEPEFEVAQTLYLPEKDLISTFLNMLTELKEAMHKELKETWLSHQTENVYKQIKIMKAT